MRVGEDTARHIRHAAIAVASVFAVWISSPRLVANVADERTAALSAPSCSECMYAIELTGLYVVDPATGISGTPVTLSGGVCSSATIKAEVAPDGFAYGFINNCEAGTWWGRIDLDTGVVTPLHPVDVLQPAHKPVFPLSFAAGEPIGYRFVPANLTSSSPIDLYAIDTLNPYTERVLYTNVNPPFPLNFGLGSAIAADRSAAYYVTQDSIFRLALPGASGTPFVPISFLRTHNLYRSAAVANFGSDGRIRIANSNVLLSIDPLLDTSDQVAIDPLTGASSVWMRRTRGGVRIAPDHGLITDEAGTTTTFTAALSKAPAADVTVTLTSSDPGEGTVSPSELVFTAADWNTPRTVTISGVDDGTSDGPQPYAILTSAASSTDPDFNNVEVLDPGVTNHQGAGPAITPAGPLTLQQGSVVTLDLAEVSDAEDPDGLLTVSLVAAPGMTVDSLSNDGGIVTATLTVPCAAALGDRLLTLDVEDSSGNHRTADVFVRVNAASQPILAYPAVIVQRDGSAAITPTMFDGAASAIDVASTGFGGAFTTGIDTGIITVTDAAPPGEYVVTVHATHRCGGGSATDLTFPLRVNDLPALTTVPQTLDRGSPAASVTLGSVVDPESSAGSLIVTAVGIPAGISVGAITNDAGTISATLSATCAAADGAQTLTLRVTDPDGGATDADLPLVVGNPAPALGAYPATVVRAGNSTDVTPDAVPSDNGAVADVSATAPGFTGTLSVNAATGVVTVANAGPAGTYTVTVTATDDCDAIDVATFPLEVLSCTYTISPLAANFTSADGSGTIEVSTHPDCSWTATTAGGSFVSITGGNAGSGDGTITYDVAANGGALGRAATLTVAGETFTVTQSAAGVPATILTALASATDVSLSWTPVSGATSFQVYRASGGPITLLTTVTTTGWTDTTVVPGIGYVYFVRAHADGGPITHSNVDLAVPFGYSAPVLTASPVRAADFTELQEAVNAARAALGWAALPFASVSPGDTVAAAHLDALRAAVDAVRAAVGASPLSYTDATITPESTRIRAIHIEQLRSGLH